MLQPPSQPRTRLDASVDAPVTSLHIEAVQPAIDLDMAVAGVGIYAPVLGCAPRCARHPCAVDVTFSSLHRNAAIAGVDLHIAVNGLYVHGAVSGMNLHVSSNRLRLHGSSPVSILQVRVFGHADFNAWPTATPAPGESPVTVTRALICTAVAILAAIDVQVLVQLVSPS